LKPTTTFARKLRMVSQVQTIFICEILKWHHFNCDVAGRPKKITRTFILLHGATASCNLNPDEPRRCQRAHRRRTTAVRIIGTLRRESKTHTDDLTCVPESKPYYAALLRRHTHCKRRTENMKDFSCPPLLRERTRSTQHAVSLGYVLRMQAK